MKKVLWKILAKFAGKLVCWSPLAFSEAYTLRKFCICIGQLKGSSTCLNEWALHLVIHFFCICNRREKKAILNFLHRYFN